MELFRIGFLPVTAVDVIDILAVAFVAYKTYKFFQRSLMPQVILVLLMAFVIWRVVDLFDLVLLKTLLREFLQVGTLALVVIFAPEIRRFLLQVSQNTMLERFRRQLSENLTLEVNHKEIIEALETLAGSGTGAIVVLTQHTDLSHIERSGDMINADVSKRLLVSIFNRTSPLHDGAVIITNNQLTAARCVLPISDDPTLPPDLGLRHRAAIGITEVSDAAAIVVSEETGAISVARGGKLKRNLNVAQLLQFFSAFYTGEEKKEKEKEKEAA
jgi:diadenylate cyclase